MMVMITPSELNSHKGTLYGSNGSKDCPVAFVIPQSGLPCEIEPFLSPL